MVCAPEHVEAESGRFIFLEPNDNIGIGGREDKTVKKVISEK
jgi:hypothetical protein